MADKSTEVETRRPFEIAIAEMRNRADLEGTDSFTIASNVADKIMTAETVEDVIAAANQGPGDMDALVGKAFKFTGYLRFQHSAEQFRAGGTGEYAIFDIVDLNGSRRTYTTGATNVVFELKRLEHLGYFADEDWVSQPNFTVRSRPTANGTLYTIDFA